MNEWYSTNLGESYLREPITDFDYNESDDVSDINNDTINNILDDGSYEPYKNRLFSDDTLVNNVKEPNKYAIDKPVNDYDIENVPFYKSHTLEMWLFIIIAILLIGGLIVFIIFMVRFSIDDDIVPNNGFGYLPNVNSPYKPLDNSQILMIQDSVYIRPDFISDIPTSSLELKPIDLVPTSHWALSNIVYTVPYYMSLQNGGINITPGVNVTENNNTSVTNVSKTPLSIAFVVNQDTARSISTPLNYKPKLVQISPLTATYSLGGYSSSRILTYVCRGCPFITFEVVNAGLTFTSVNRNTVQFMGSYMLFEQNGFTYIIFGLTQQNIVDNRGLSFSNVNGVVRIAFITKEADIPTFANMLLAYSNVYPVYSSVTYGDGDNYNINFTTRGLNDELLMLQPNQINDIKGVNPVNITYNLAVRGNLETYNGIVGNFWQVKVQSIPISITSNLPSNQKDMIMEQWLLEVDNYISNNSLNNPTFISSMSSIAIWSRYCIGCAQLLNIPFVLKLSNDPLYADSLTNFANYIGSILNYILLLFRYDTIWGGLNTNISSTGNQSYPAYYNHLYVVGGISYCLYSYLNATSDPSIIVKFQTVIITMYRDVLNPSSDDKYYPVFRNMDWYFGQTYNTGIDAISLGDSSPGYKSESEISIAMTSIYSMYLLSRRMTIIGNIGQQLIDLTKTVVQVVYNSYVSYYGNIKNTNNKLLPVSFTSEIGLGFGSVDDFSFGPCINNPNLIDSCYYASLSAPFTEFSNNEHASDTLATYFDDLSNMSITAIMDEKYSILAYIYSMMAYDATNECLFKDAYDNLNGRIDSMAYGVTISNTLLWIANRTQINIS